MLTLLIILALAWTIFWAVWYLVDWSYAAPVTEPRTFCETCGRALDASDAGSSSANRTVQPNAANQSAAQSSATNSNSRSAGSPLFEAPNEKDDLQTIKGIGDVMEKTLNDLGITTFKQLASFQEAEIKMVSDRLSEANAGFGDRIERDEWVQQAKALA